MPGLLKILLLWRLPESVYIQWNYVDEKRNSDTKIKGKNEKKKKQG